MVAVSLALMALPLPQRVDLHGGSFSTKSMSLWELHKYKDTELLRKAPLCYAPFKSYLLVGQHVKVESKNNKNYLIIDTDLVELVKEDADYNKSHAIKYKGTDREKVRKIYKYCLRTKYVIHTKYARDVFEKRQGDCAGIASAFYVMCKKNHIPVRYVIGWADNECHAWNRVKVNGKWYWIDATLELWLSRTQFAGRSVMEMW